MYKLILGNVRITVAEDDIPREQAAAAARKAIGDAQRQGRLLAHLAVERDPGGSGLITLATDRSNGSTVSKTLRQSLLDSAIGSLREKFFAADPFAPADSWFDSDTGQKWCGSVVNDTKQEIIKTLEEWSCTTK